MKLIKNAHKSHASYSCTLSLLFENFWWPGVAKDVIDYISKCKFCKDYGCPVFWQSGYIGKHDSSIEYILLVGKDDSVIPTITIDNIIEGQENDKDLQEVKKAMEEVDFTITSEYKNSYANIYISKGTLIHEDQFVIPKSLRLAVLEASHVGHPGKNTMIRSISQYLWWPNLAKDAEKYVKCCASCTRMRKPEAPEPIRSTSLPWIKIAIESLL